MGSKLLYFTNSYPFGIGEQWKANELNVLVKHFDKITVVPFSYGGNFNTPKQLPNGVELVGPLFREQDIKMRKIDLFRILFRRDVFKFAREFIGKGVYLSKGHLINWISGSFNVVRLLGNNLIVKLLVEADSETVLYFYWGQGSCEILPFIHKRFHRTFVRMHRYDLFEYLNDGYIPYRERLLDVINIAAPSSLIGQLHLRGIYPRAKASIEVVRCGTKGNGKISAASRDNVMRVASCSLLSPVKRVHLMIECLQFIGFPILWRHIGDGAQMEELKQLVENLGLGDTFIFEGLMDSSVILDFYTENSFDVFVNTSSSEGVPFSIMEAFSVGIPVIATNVGGTSEIVDETNGILVREDLTPSNLAIELAQFYQLSIDKKLKMRQSSFLKYREMCDSDILTERLASILKQ